MNLRRLFQRTQPKVELKTAKPALRTELGAGGVSFMGGFVQTDEFNADLSGLAAVEMYDKMRRTDAQVAALINTCRQPILSAKWNVGRPESEELAAKVTDEHLEFARYNLFQRLNFQEFLNHATSCVWAGYAICEVVYDVEDGKYVLAKLAPRLATTVEKWNVNDQGDLESVEQFVYKGSRYINVTLPRDKIALFVYAQEANNYLGHSVLRPCFKHWRIKDAVYRYDMIRAERYAIGVPVITLPEEYTDDLYDMADTIGKHWKGASQSHVVMPQGMTLEIVAMKGGEALDLLETIKHHNEEIAKVGLAQFINLGQTETGSRALGEITTQFFYDAEEGWARSIAATINRDILWPLMDLNFPDKPRPVITVEDLGWVGLTELIELLKGVGTTYLPYSVDIENALRNRANLPLVTEKEVEERKDQEPSGPNETKGEPDSDEPDIDDPEDDEIAHAVDRISERISVALSSKPSEVQTSTEDDFWRPLRPSERYVALRSIDGMIDDSRDRLLRIMLAARDQWIVDLADQVVQKMPAGPDALMTVTIPDADLQPAIKSMKPVLKDVYSFGSEQVKREIRAQAKDVALRQEQMEDDDKDELLLALLLLSLGRLARKTEEAVQSVALGQYRTIGPKEYTPADAAQLSTDVAASVEQDARLGATVAVTEMLNLGRDMAAQAVAEQIAICEYSAIMDDGTCTNCRAVDGKRVLFGSKEYYDMMPPLRSKAHGTCQGMSKCRCIWIYLTAT